MAPDLSAFDLKVVLGLIASGLSIYGHMPYLASTLRGETRPHLFTWVLWTLTTGIAFVAQVAGHGGPGAWTMGVTTIFCLIILLAGLRHGKAGITKLDGVMFALGLLAIPGWLVTDDPLTAVILVAFAEIIAFAPTIRKSWHRPHEEYAFTYGLNLARHALSIMALSEVNLVTTIPPLTLWVANAATFAVIMLRRHALAAEAEKA